MPSVVHLINSILPVLSIPTLCKCPFIFISTSTVSKYVIVKNSFYYIIRKREEMSMILTKILKSGYLRRKIQMSGQK